MGLRLYTPPVESDVNEKPAAEKSSAALRSSIRRNRVHAAPRHRHVERLIDRSLDLDFSGGTEQQTFYDLISGTRGGNDGFFANSRRRTTRPTALEEAQAVARAHATAQQEAEAHRARTTLAQTAARNSIYRRERHAGSVSYAAPELQYETSSLRTTQEGSSRSDSGYAGPRIGARTPLTAARPERRGYVPEVTFADDVSRRSPSGDRLSSGSPASQAPRWVPPPPRPHLSRSMSRHEHDGLGDRARSLSPADAENLWDTLLTTVTPDPQPPSIGSSFASTNPNLSRSATQTSAHASSRTSFTWPEVHEDYENPFDSCYNSDSEHAHDEANADELERERDQDAQAVQEEEGEEEDDDELNGDDVPSFLRLRSNRRSYAEVAAETRELMGGSGANDALELLSMQRIVRHLARREDIPDEWWAEAGLSRTLSREGES